MACGPITSDARDDGGDRGGGAGSDGAASDGDVHGSAAGPSSDMAGGIGDWGRSDPSG